MEGTIFEVWRNRNRLALLIGIDAYGGEKLHPLAGCVNDMETLAEILHSKYQFAVLTLLDRDATRESMLKAMKALLEIAKAGDQIVFAFSGHGSCIPLPDGRIFQTLVPSDSSRDGQWKSNRDITDRELFGWVWRVSEKTPSVTLIIDACQAGGVVRDFQPMPRGATGESGDLGALEREKSAFVMPEGELRRPGPSGWLPVSDRYVLLAACLAEEFCGEFKDPETELRRGLFSCHLQRALNRSQTPLTYRELFDEVAAAVTRHRGAQHPQLEGNIDRAVFGQEVFRPSFFLPVLSRQGNSLRLGGGAAHGVMLGSTWLLTLPTSRDGLSEELGQAEIRQVEPTEAVAEVHEENVAGLIEEGCRAFELSRPVDSRYRVLLTPAVRGDAELQKLLAKSPLLDIRSSGPAETADLVLHRIPARASCSERDALPQLPLIAADSWVFLDSSGVQLAPTWPVGAPESRRKVVSILERRARHRFLLGLEHPDPSRAVDSRVTIRAFRLFEEGSMAKPREENLPEGSRLPSGARFAFRLEHSNPVPLQLTLIGLGLSGGIAILYPVRNRFEPWPSGTVLEIGFQAADALECCLPEGFPFPGEPPFQGADDALLFLFTERTTRNLPSFSQPGLRSGRLGRRSTPADWAIRIAEGEFLRTDAPADTLERPEAWGLLRWKFFLEP